MANVKAPERASYSLFPPPDHVLRRQQSKRMSRARASSGTMTKRSASASSSIGDNSSTFEENKPSIEIDRPLATRSTDDLPSSKSKEERRDSTLQKLSSSRSLRRKLSDLPTIYSPPADVTEHKPLSAPATTEAISPIGPPPTKSLPSVPRPSPTINTTTLKPPSKPAVQPNGSRHARNGTASTVTSVTKPSPVTPVSQTSGPSLFSPITPPSAGPSPVKYPTIPRLSSSPAPSVAEAWTSPPRASHSRADNRSQSTTADLISSYAHTRDGSFGRTAPVPANQMRRAASNATARTAQSRSTATPRPSVSNEQKEPTPGVRSIFPTYSPEAPLLQQGARPGQGQGQGYTPQFHLPAQRIESKPYSQRSAASSLTREALEALNASNDGGLPQTADAKSSEPKGNTNQDHPPRSQSLPQNQSQQQQNGTTFLDTASVASAQPPRSNPQQPMPTFAPPPQRAASKSSRTRTFLTKPRPAPKDKDKSKHPQSTKPNPAASGALTRTATTTTNNTKSHGLRKEGQSMKQGEETKNATLDFQLQSSSYRAATSATTRYDKELEAMTTTATTTIVEYPPAKRGPLHEATKIDYAQNHERYAGIIEGREFTREEAELQHQHSVAVALGAVAFVMGAGVELVGGAVNNVKGGLKGGRGRHGR